ncbi:MAG: hypothetical protein NTY98_01025, partial [Verrucomicrobia bacterium]|nr:hypothetical protein [Verrucomicrobiota bacterium]
MSFEALAKMEAGPESQNSHQTQTASVHPAAVSFISPAPTARPTAAQVSAPRQYAKPSPFAPPHTSPKGAAHHSEGLPSLSEATLVPAKKIRKDVLSVASDDLRRVVRIKKGVKR